MRFNNFILLCTLFLLFAGQSAFGQKRPKWIDGYFEEFQNSYIEVVVGSGYDLNSAKEKASRQIIERRSLVTGTDATVSLSGNDVKVESEKKLIVSARIVDEYYEHVAAGEYKVYLLVQTSKNPAFTMEPVTVSEKYPFSAKVFFPGMAQIYQGSVIKGSCFISAEALLIGGIVVSECLRADYTQQISMTQNASLKQKYLKNSNTCTTVRNVSIAGAVALYVWNIIDGIVAKGQKHILVGETKMAFATYSDLHSVGLALNINF